VPHTTDSDEEVDFKVQETIDFGRLFLRRMPYNLRPRALGVVHGRTPDQIRRCVEAYAEMGIRYVGFGSFGTSGPSGSVNLVSKDSLGLLRLTHTLACEYGLRLHVFGIGSPGPLIRIVRAGITPSSFDSAGWWKAAGFGKVFFPEGRQLHVTRVDSWVSTRQGIEQEKERRDHKCPFCTSVTELRHSRIARVMHNLNAMLDTVERVHQW
jgi:queuine/archaeosine tRNA-ribosyltransferase